MKRILKRSGRLALIGIIQFTIVFAILEVGCRLLFPEIRNRERFVDLAYLQVLNSQINASEYNFDAKLGFRPPADRSFQFSSAEYSYSGRFNSLGFRTREIVPKQPNEYRVMLVGDSMFWGVGVPDEQTIPAVIERETQARVRVYNFSVVGYNTTQERLVAEMYMKQASADHLVLGFFVGNDLVTNWVTRITSNGSYEIDAKRELAVKRLIEDDAGLLINSAVFRKLALGGYMTRLRYKIGTSPEVIGQTFEHIEELAAAAEGSGIRFTVVLLYPRDSIEGGVRGWWSNSRNAGERVARFCESRSIEVLDTARVLNDSSENGYYYYPIDGHFNKVGNETVGRAIVRELFAERFKPE